MVLAVLFFRLSPSQQARRNRKIWNQEAAETLTVCELQSDACRAAQGWIPDRKRFCKDCDACLAGHKVQGGSPGWVSEWAASILTAAGDASVNEVAMEDWRWLGAELNMKSFCFVFFCKWTKCVNLLVLSVNCCGF